MGEEVHTSYPPYAMPMMGVLAFLIISGGIGLIVCYCQKKARQNANLNNIGTMSVSIQRHMGTTGILDFLSWLLA